MKSFLYPIDKRDGTSSASTWEAMNPLQMAEKIAQMAQSKKRKETSLKINTSFLLHETEDVPPAPRNATGKVPSEILLKVDREYIVEPPKQTAMTILSTKRKHPAETLSQSSASIATMDVETKLSPWDPSFLIAYNPHDTTAKMAVKGLDALAKRFESMPKSYACQSSYKRFRDALFQKVLLLSQQHDISFQQKNLFFSQIYSSSFQHMKALIAFAETMEREDQVNKESCNSKGMKPMDCHSISYSSGEDSSPIRPVLKRVYDKKIFTQCMNEWLIDNWTNPYPDDDGLTELAFINNTTSMIVSNWLINARTRKWRPAIVKAYKASRPASVLKEDSINFFKGLPLREL